MRPAWRCAWPRPHRRPRRRWALARPLDQITLPDVYRALGEPELFAIGLADDDPQCLVEQAVNGALSQTLEAARALVTGRFTEVPLADLVSALQA
ncbi:MAG: Rrf2 family transcriptional regulator [Sphingomonadaceae bacterium]